MNQIKRTYTYLALIATIVLSILAFLSISSLQNAADSVIASAKSMGYIKWYSVTTWVSFGLCYIVSVILYINNNHWRFLFFTLAITILWLNIDYLFLRAKLFHFRQETGLWEGGFSVNGIMAVVTSLTVCAVCIASYMIIRNRKKAKSIKV